MNSSGSISTVDDAPSHQRQVVAHWWAMTITPSEQRHPRQLYRADGSLNVGRFRAPLEDVRWRLSGAQALLRTKRWVYFSITTDAHFVSGAVVDVGYAAHKFVYVVPTADGSAWSHHGVDMLHALRPAVQIEGSSVEGRACWRRSDAVVEIQAVRDGWRLRLDVTLDDRRLHGEVALTRSADRESVALVHSWPDGPAAYTHKEAGLDAAVALRCGEETLGVSGVGVLDWTSGVMPRKTRWRWASAAWRAGDERYGLNLSDLIYLDDQGRGRENALWIGDRVFELPSVRYEVPERPDVDPWWIRSEGSDAVALRFTPRGARREDLNLGVVQSSFCQPYGLFEGHVTTTEGQRCALQDVFGVVEDHRSLW